VRYLAAEGRTVLLSSHLMSEMAITADHIIVLGRGKVLADAPVGDLVRDWTRTNVRVRTPRLEELVPAISGPGVEVVQTAPGVADITGITAEAVGDTAARIGIPIHELTPQSGSLEEAYLALTGESVEYKSKELS
jgi:ABC-2 type transport system ATP-binding protein